MPSAMPTASVVPPEILHLIVDAYIGLFFPDTRAIGLACKPLLLVNKTFYQLVRHRIFAEVTIRATTTSQTPPPSRDSSAMVLKQREKQTRPHTTDGRRGDFGKSFFVPELRSLGRAAARIDRLLELLTYQHRDPHLGPPLLTTVRTVILDRGYGSQDDTVAFFARDSLVRLVGYLADKRRCPKFASFSLVQLPILAPTPSFKPTNDSRIAHGAVQGPLPSSPFPFMELPKAFLQAFHRLCLSPRLDTLHLAALRAIPSRLLAGSSIKRLSLHNVTVKITRVSKSWTDAINFSGGTAHPIQEIQLRDAHRTRDSELPLPVFAALLLNFPKMSARQLTGAFPKLDCLMVANHRHVEVEDMIINAPKLSFLGFRNWEFASTWSPVLLHTLHNLTQVDLIIDISAHMYEGSIRHLVIDIETMILSRPTLTQLSLGIVLTVLYHSTQPYRKLIGDANLPHWFSLASVLAGLPVDPLRVSLWIEDRSAFRVAKDERAAYEVWGRVFGELERQKRVFQLEVPAQRLRSLA